MSDFFDAPVILTHSGRYLNLADPQPEDIELDDIAYGLSQLCRFTGQCGQFYSVGQHSVIVAGLLQSYEMYAGPEVALAGLLHDASEAFTGDINTPLKTLLPDFRRVEQRLEAAIERRFGLMLSPLERSLVKRADLSALAAERKLLLPATPDHPWPVEALDLDPVDPQQLRQLSPQSAYDMFLDAFNILKGVHRV